MTDLAPDESAIDLDYEIYEYDDRGNIIKITSKPTGQDGERVLNYTYGNIKNPYHYSFKKYYESAYYISFFLGVNQRNDYGLNPNLVNSENRSYEVNEFNYPIKETKSSDSEPTIIVYEYY